MSSDKMPGDTMGSELESWSLEPELKSIYDYLQSEESGKDLNSKFINSSERISRLVDKALHLIDPDIAHQFSNDEVLKRKSLWKGLLNEEEKITAESAKAYADFVYATTIDPIASEMAALRVVGSLAPKTKIDPYFVNTYVIKDIVRRNINDTFNDPSDWFTSKARDKYEEVILRSIADANQELPHKNDHSIINIKKEYERTGTKIYMRQDPLTEDDVMMKIEKALDAKGINDELRYYIKSAVINNIDVRMLNIINARYDDPFFYIADLTDALIDKAKYIDSKMAALHGVPRYYADKIIAYISANSREFTPDRSLISVAKDNFINMARGRVVEELMKEEPFKSDSRYINYLLIDQTLNDNFAPIAPYLIFVDNINAKQIYDKVVSYTVTAVRTPLKTNPPPARRSGNTQSQDEAKLQYSVQTPLQSGSRFRLPLGMIGALAVLAGGGYGLYRLLQSRKRKTPSERQAGEE